MHFPGKPCLVCRKQCFSIDSDSQMLVQCSKCRKLTHAKCENITGRFYIIIFRITCVHCKGPLFKYLRGYGVLSHRTFDLLTTFCEGDKYLMIIIIICEKCFNMNYEILLTCSSSIRFHRDVGLIKKSQSVNKTKYRGHHQKIKSYG